MDITLRNPKRTWIPLGIAVLALGAALLLWLLLWPSSGDHTTSPTSPSTTHSVRQAPWRIDTYAVGATSRPTKRERTVVRRQRAPLTRLVRDVYGAVLLDRAGRARVIDRYFTERAGTAFSRTRVGILAGTVVKTQRRRARIGIQGEGARRAVASVKVVARVGDEPKPKRIATGSTLYLEKGDGGWRVIAFTVDQRPAKSKGESNKQRDRKSKKQGGRGKG